MWLPKPSQVKDLPGSIQCYCYEEKFYVDTSQKMFRRQIAMLQAMVEIITKTTLFFFGGGVWEVTSVLGIMPTVI